MFCVVVFRTESGKIFERRLPAACVVDFAVVEAEALPAARNHAERSRTINAAAVGGGIQRVDDVTEATSRPDLMTKRAMASPSGSVTASTETEPMPSISQCSP